MPNTIRAALAGYNINDTNLDHFSLFGDEDNVLIKRLTQAQPTINDGVDVSYAHNLSYIPLFMSYYSPNQNGIWTVMNNQYNAFSVPDAIVGIDTSNLNFSNGGGHASGNIQPAYDIFYDDMSQTGSPAIVESKNLLKVARPGKSVFSKNPNDFIMHSDLNNFKILKQGVSTGLTLPGTGANLNIAHGANVQEPYKFFAFVKAPDGKTFLTGNAIHMSYDESFGVTSKMSSTNIVLNSFFTSSDKTIDVAWIIYGSGKDNTIDNSGNIISVAKDGHDVRTETNPDYFNFHSNYPTLKYYLSAAWPMGSVTTTTVKTIAHNLGYAPFFVGFLKDIAGILVNSYAIAPYFYSRSNLAHPLQSVGGMVYVDSTNIYLKAYYQTNAIGTSFSFDFYYKLFKNNLGL
jgi:hypothetical protein